MTATTGNLATEGLRQLATERWRMSESGGPERPKEEESLGWLGEVSAEDLQRSKTPLKDPYATSENQEPAVKILDAFVEASRRDRVIERLVLIGTLLLLASTFLQVFRAESLERYKPIANAESQQQEVSKKSVKENPTKRKSTTKIIETKRVDSNSETLELLLPKIATSELILNSDNRLQIRVRIQNDSTRSSAPSRLIINFESPSVPAKRKIGEISAVPPQSVIKLDLSAPYGVKQIPSPQSLNFTTIEGHEITYRVKLEKL